MDEHEDFEGGVIGALLLAGEMGDGSDTSRVMSAYSNKGMDETWFRNVTWKKLWKAVKAEFDEHHGVDKFLVANRFGNGGMAAVTRAIECCGQVSYAEYYCMKLRDVHLYHLAHKMCMQVVQNGKPGSVSKDLEELAKGLREIQGLAAKADCGLKKVSELAAPVMDEMRILSDERFVKKNRRFYIGLPLPWDFLNEKYMGLKPGLHIIAALPSQGKTTMGVAISLFWCQQGIKHGFVCIDMTAKELLKRYATLSSQVSLAKMNWGGSPEDVRRFGEAVDQDYLSNVDITESYMVEHIRDEAYRGVYTHGWKAIVIDYLQLVQDDFKGRTATYEQVKLVTQAIKQLSKDLNVPIVCLVQIARAAAKEYRETGRRPGLEDLGDSAEIARAASTVSVLVGDADVKKYWEQNPPHNLLFGGFYRTPNGDVVNFVEQPHLLKTLRPVWFYMIKNQQGPIGDIPFVMYANYFMFRPADPDAEIDTVQVGGKDKKNNHLKFETIRDDWLHPDSDEIYEKNGAMGVRGLDWGD